MALTNSVSSVTTIIRGLIDDNLKTDGRDSFIYESDSVFTISEDFISSATITVFVNGTETTGFTYDSDNNQVTITDSLTANDTILIKYSYYKKYSDTEIQGYLNSSLSYFVVHQYKKIFEIDSNDEINAINDYIPTTNELYFIAFVAAIVIDPQNIRISIPDLSLSAKRDKSDQEQIKDAFIDFTNFLGTIGFERT